MEGRAARSRGQLVDLGGLEKARVCEEGVRGAAVASLDLADHRAEPTLVVAGRGHVEPDDDRARRIGGELGL